MLVPLIFAALLLIIIARTAKRLGVSGTWQMVVSFSLFIIFAIATQGVIRVRADEKTGDGALKLGNLTFFS